MTVGGFSEAPYCALWQAGAGWSACSTDGWSSEPEWAAHGNGTWVIADYDAVYRSTDDGATWSTPSTAPTNVDDLIYADGLFVILDSDLLYTSPDGDQWTQIGVDVSSSFTQAWSVAYGNGVYVVPKDAIYRSSDDGDTWTGATDYHASMGDIAFGDGVFISVGADSKIIRSSDADTWEDVSPTTSSPETLFNVVYSEATDSWLATGYNAQAWYSNDGGTTWTEVPYDLTTQGPNFDIPNAVGVP